jgi:mono/diheme cytochrome c family protein
METTQLDENVRLVQPEQIATVKDRVKSVMEQWAAAEAAALAIPKAPVLFPASPRASDEEKEKVAASVRHGRELFYGTIANCIKCHGDSALGDGQTTDYDDWSKEFIEKGEDRKLIDTYVSLGLLPPRTIRPRNLRLGVFRGGMRPIDIYWRIMNGIEGTPMPALANNVRQPSDPPEAKKLAPEEIWDLVNYVRSLGYESINDPREAYREAGENLFRGNL